MNQISALVSALLVAAGTASFGQIVPPPPPAQPATALPKPSQVQPPSQTTPAPSGSEPTPNAIPVPTGPALNRVEREQGVVIEDIRIGDGPEISATSSAVLHYEGSFKQDSHVFQSSFALGTPSAVQIPSALQGWRIGLPGMKVGGVRRLTLPAAVAYGDKGKEGMVPPNTDVVFIVELKDCIHIEDVKVGEGEPVVGRFIAIGPFTITDREGKVLEKAEREQPYIWVYGEYQPMDLALEGMKPGGHRRITVPAEFALQKGLGKTHPVQQKVVIDFEMMYYRCIDVKR